MSSPGPLSGEWAAKRLLADELIQYLHSTGNSEDEIRANRIRDCCSKLYYQERRPPNAPPYRRVVGSYRPCGLKGCPLCGWKKRGRRKRRASQGFERLRQQYPTARFLHLVLSDKNAELEDLPSANDSLRDARKKLVRRTKVPHLGYFWFIEVTESDGVANQHLHLLLMLPAGYFAGRNYLSREKWVALWADCLGVPYDPIVRVITVGSDLSAEELAGRIINIVGYGSKLPDEVISTDPEWYLRYVRMKKGHLVGSGGTLRELVRKRKTRPRQGSPHEVGVVQWDEGSYLEAGSTTIML